MKPGIAPSACPCAQGDADLEQVSPVLCHGQGRAAETATWTCTIIEPRLKAPCHVIRAVKFATPVWSAHLCGDAATRAEAARLPLHDVQRQVHLRGRRKHTCGRRFHVGEQPAWRR